MNDEDSTKALFPEPNAYLQNCLKSKTSKVVFSEPYDNMPPFYLNNNFKKGGCDCVHHPQCAQSNIKLPNFNGFNFQNLLPIISSILGKNDSINMFMPIIKAFGDGKNVDFNKIITSLLTNKEVLNGIKNKFVKTPTSNNVGSIEETDFPIDDYKRVDE